MSQKKWTIILSLSHIKASFRPTVERLSDIADRGQKLLQNASDKDLTEFTE